MMKAFLISLLAALLLAVLPSSSHNPGDGYQQHFRFVSKYPDETADTPLAWENNGVAHDDSYWYFATNDYYGEVEALWRIPVTVDLASVQVNTPGVSVIRSDQIWCPTANGSKNLRNDLKYWHFGDLVAYKPKDSEWFLLVPLEGGNSPAIAILRAENFQCLGLDVLQIDNKTPPTLNNAAAWCATDPQGYVYSSPDKWYVPGESVASIFKYRLNWNTLGVDPQNPVQLTFLEKISLKDKNGQPLPPSEISGYSQGGEFSADGRLLYVTSGSGEDSDDDHGGIQVFDTTTWQRVARSDNDEDAFFRYDFNSSWPPLEEPEGLTIWDLDEFVSSYGDPPKAPGIDGQLHVVLLDNDVGNKDDFSIYNYTNSIYVDQAWLYESSGQIRSPFKTVGAALAFYQQNEYFSYGRWTGARIKIHTGHYAETLTISRRVQLSGWGGRAVVGTQGQVALTPEGAINIDGGVMKLH